jgi:hypothetical protein
MGLYLTNFERRAVHCTRRDKIIYLSIYYYIYIYLKYRMYYILNI